MTSGIDWPEQAKYSPHDAESYSKNRDHRQSFCTAELHVCKTACCMQRLADPGNGCRPGQNDLPIKGISANEYLNLA